MPKSNATGRKPSDKEAHLPIRSALENLLADLGQAPVTLRMIGMADGNYPKEKSLEDYLGHYERAAEIRRWSNGSLPALPDPRDEPRIGLPELSEWCLGAIGEWDKSLGGDTPKANGDVVAALGAVKDTLIVLAKGQQIQATTIKAVADKLKVNKARASNSKGRKKSEKRGRHHLSSTKARERRSILKAWDDARSKKESRKEFCCRNRIKVTDLEKFQDWDYTLRIRTGTQK